MKRLPTLFVSHGSPMFAIEPGISGPNLIALGVRLAPDIRAIVVVSPHWQTIGIKVGTTPQPETIHDFGGFPPVLYTLQYNPPGEPALAQRVMDLLQTAGLDAKADPSRGLDHGAWVPLRYLRPQAELPVIQVSMPRDLNAHTAYALGRALQPLRDEGILVVGSGSLTHNLYELRQDIRDPEYAQAFADWARHAVETGNAQALIDYRTMAPHAERAHPTDEHYLPLVVAMGAAGPQASGTLVEGGMTYRTLSMDSFLFDS